MRAILEGRDTAWNEHIASCWYIMIATHITSKAPEAMKAAPDLFRALDRILKDVQRENITALAWHNTTMSFQTSI